MVRRMHTTFALILLFGAAIASAQVSSKLQITAGVVKTVSASSLTVEQSGNQVVFAVNKSTRFIGKGTAGDLVLRPHRVSDFVKAGDQVTVKFRHDEARMNAVEVRVVRR